MNEVVSNEQWVEFMTVFRSQTEKTDALIAENGRNIKALLEETKQILKIVSSVYSEDKSLKRGGEK